MTSYAELNKIAADADKAWTAAYLAVCPKGVWPGDFRYTAASRGAEGSDLRKLYDEFVRAGEAAHEAFLTLDGRCTCCMPDH